MKSGRARRPKRRPKRRSRTARSRWTVAIIAVIVAAGAGIALLLQATRPPTAQPFHFPAVNGATPTVEIDASERARLQAILDGLRPTPGDDKPVRR